MKILMAEYQPWQHRVEDGEHKYARFFQQDGHQIFWITNFLNFNRLIRRREEDLAYWELWRRGVESTEMNLKTLTPLAPIPYIRFPGLDNLQVAKNCLKFTVPNLRQILMKHDFGHVDILWLGAPRLYSILNLVSFDILVHRMSDDVTSFSTEPRTIGQVEAEICRRADIVFATAHSLVRKAEQFARRVCYLPNGVDFELFNAPNLKIPTDLAQIPEPRIILVSMIDDWLDFEGLDFAAQAYPDYNFVIIGPAHGAARTKKWLERLKIRENIYLWGSRPFAQVPRYLAHSQVGIIPFVKNKLTESINPIKLFEYAAAGLPIVCRELQEVQNLKSPALLYNSPDEFVAHIETALRQRESLREAGVAFGRANAWAQRYEIVKRELATINASSKVGSN